MCGMSAIKQSCVASCTQPASKTECEKPYQGARRGGGGEKRGLEEDEDEGDNDDNGNA